MGVDWARKQILWTKHIWIFMMLEAGYQAKDLLMSMSLLISVVILWEMSSPCSSSTDESIRVKQGGYNDPKLVENIRTREDTNTQCQKHGTDRLMEKTYWIRAMKKYDSEEISSCSHHLSPLHLLVCIIVLYPVTWIEEQINCRFCSSVV